MDIETRRGPDALGHGPQIELDDINDAVAQVMGQLDVDANEARRILGIRHNAPGAAPQPAQPVANDQEVRRARDALEQARRGQAEARATFERATAEPRAPIDIPRKDGYIALHIISDQIKSILPINSYEYFGHNPDRFIYVR